MTFPSYLRWFAIASLAAWSALSARAQITGAGTAPYYTAQSIVNAATQTVEALAPNVIATIYGANLSHTTHAIGNSDLVDRSLPASFDGVEVYINSIPCRLFFISPGQINCLVPYELIAGPVSLIVHLQGTAGPSVNIQLTNTSPGFFVWNGNYAVAVHLNGQLISAASPAVAKEIIVLYAGGLGKTAPDTRSGLLATAAAPIFFGSQLQVLLNGLPLPPGSVLYAGLTPGFAGLYQINLVLPAALPSNPEIRVAIGPQISPASVQLAVR